MDGAGPAGNRSGWWAGAAGRANGSAGAGGAAGAAGARGDGRDEALARLEVAVLAAAFAAAVLGNAGVLLALRRCPREAPRPRLFVRHLSLADLAVAFFQVLPQLCWDATHRFRGPDALCRVVKHLQVFGMFASAYVLVAMAADRCVAVCRPLEARRRPARRARLLVAAAWALSLALSAPQYLVFSLVEVDNATRAVDCWATFAQPWGPRAYVTWMAAGVFVAPALALAACYGCICRRLWRNARAKAAWQAGGGPGGGGRGRLGPRVSGVGAVSRAKMRTVRMTLVIVGAYVACWAPFFATQLWSVWDETSVWVESENPVVTITALLAPLNSCCNPWIYMFFSGHLLQDCVQSFPCCQSMKQKFHKDNSNSVSRRQTLYTNNRSPGSSVGAWKDSPKSSKSVRFLPVSA